MVSVLMFHGKAIGVFNDVLEMEKAIDQVKKDCMDAEDRDFFVRVVELNVLF
jgi:hypothetical protein